MRSLASEMRRTTDLTRVQEVASAGTTETVKATRLEAVRAEAREAIWPGVLEEVRAAAERGDSSCLVRIPERRGLSTTDCLETVLPEIVRLLEEAGFRVDTSVYRSVLVDW